MTTGLRVLTCYISSGCVAWVVCAKCRCLLVTGGGNAPRCDLSTLRLLVDDLDVRYTEAIGMSMGMRSCEVLASISMQYRNHPDHEAL
jgi:hypothetical protein